MTTTNDTDEVLDLSGRLTQLVDDLSLEEKVRLLTGRDFWSTAPLERIGLGRLLLSDGPSGVRGEFWDERSPSLNLPSGTALGASWDTDLARRYGNVLGHEARRKGVHALLGPTINIQRSPLGGRHFECLSEDPLLTADLAAAYVMGVQQNGVGATLKHYIANDFESDRFTVDVKVDDRTLRELYLFAFEKAVVDARAWLVMSSYNSVNGATVTENDLLETPLNSEWGFDGVVVSDWTAVRSVNSARFSQDLVMPGPTGPWGEDLVEEVRSGRISEAAVDRKVLRILALAARVGALDGFEIVSVAEDAEDGVAFAYSAATAGSVLVRNAGQSGCELPWAAAELTKVAMVGHNASVARTQGGGSATVMPERVVSPLDGIRMALPDAEVSYSIGAVVQEGIAPFPADRITNPATGAPGALVRFLGEDGRELYREDRLSTALVYFGGEAPLTTARVLEVSTVFVPGESGRLRIGFAGVGTVRMFIDDTLRHEATVTPSGTDLGAAFLSPTTSAAAVDVRVGEAVAIRYEFDLVPGRRHEGAFSITFGTEPDVSDPDGLIAEAVAAARAADVAVVVVGTNSRVESEGYDRTSLDLPGRQDDLVRAVSAVNPRTVVVVNAGSPVLMPWREEVAAVLLTWFGGQEIGRAIADMLLGAAEPGGRLPTSWPATVEDVPVLDVTPRDGVVRYDEGVHVGYRAWLRQGSTPAYEFGYGLGYTSWSLDEAAVDTTNVSPGGSTRVRVGVTNTGDRSGKQVVQVYASREDTAIDRPVRWLVGHAAVFADPQESVVADIEIDGRSFAHWADGAWHHERGEFALHIGTSVGDLPLTSTVTVR